MLIQSQALLDVPLRQRPHTDPAPAATVTEPVDGCVSQTKTYGWAHVDTNDVTGISESYEYVGMSQGTTR